MTRKRTSHHLPLFLILVGGLLVVVALMFGLRTTVDRSVNTPTSVVLDETTVPRVSLKDAKAAFDTQSAVFVDVRSMQAYAQAHIPGALSIPLSELPSRADELRKDQWIITY